MIEKFKFTGITRKVGTKKVDKKPKPVKKPSKSD